MVADSVSSVSASACHIGGPKGISPGKKAYSTFNSYHNSKILLLGLYIINGKRMKYSIKLHVGFWCKMRFESFPFDSQVKYSSVHNNRPVTCFAKPALISLLRPDSLLTFWSLNRPRNFTYFLLGQLLSPNL